MVVVQITNLSLSLQTRWQQTVLTGPDILENNF